MRPWSAAGPSKWVLLRLEIKQNHWSIIKKKKSNLLPIETRCSDIQASTSIHSRCWCQCSRDWCVHSKMPSCCMIVAALTVLIRINWRWVNEVFHLHRIFSSHNCHEENLHASSVHYHQQCFAVNVKVEIVHDFLIGPYLLHWQLSAHIYWVFWRKSYQNAGRNPVGTQEKGVVPAWWVCGSLFQSGPRTSHCHLTTVAWLDGAGLWLGLPGYQTSHQWTSSYGATLKPWSYCLYR